MTCEIDYQDYQRALEFDQRISGMAALQFLTKTLIKELNPKEGDKVLDVGTGTGRLGVILGRMVRNGFVTGIDSGYGMLRVARDKISKSQMDNFFLVLGKAEALPFLPEAFDSACLMLSFHHFTDPERAMAEIYRVLKPKGHLTSLDPVLKEAIDEEERRLNASIEEAFQLAHGPEFRFFTIAQLRGMYGNAGFSIEASQGHDFSFDQIGFDGIPMGPHWFQAYELLRFRREKGLVKRFEQNYFTLRRKGEQLRVKGKITWVTIKAEKR
jgi:SAM-dependent methyltransferase